MRHRTTSNHFFSIISHLTVIMLLAGCANVSLAGIPKPQNPELNQVYTIGDLPILQVSPDFYPQTQIQANNTNPKTKIRPKRSQDISHNYVGTTPPRLPRSEAFDLQPFRRVHLIDGDRSTLWMNRGQARANVQPEWVRIDLPYEMAIKQVTIWPINPQDGGWPADITVQISRDGCDWQSVYHTPDHAPLTVYGPIHLPFSIQQAKQIRITAKQLRTVSLGAAAGAVALGYGFCISDIDVINDQGDNVALLSKGAGVTVSSTNYGYGDKRSMHDMLWPIHYDLGVKHIKIAYWDSTLNWHYVEVEKGVYTVDPVTDQAISDSAANGLEVYMTLCYGNWLYADQKPSPDVWNFWQFPFQKPPVPQTDEQIEAFCNYCRYVAKHFKGRIQYYEIWNEQNIGYSWPPDQVKSFCKLVKAAAKAVKEADPEAKMMLGGACFMDVDYFEEMFKYGVAEVVDVICWHPYQWEVGPEEAYVPLYYRQDASIANRFEVPETDREKYPYQSYREVVAKIKDLAKTYGFKGNEYHANETTWVSPYPEPDFGVAGGPVSEMVKAKYVARTIALHSDMAIPVYYNETWNSGIVYWDVSVLRSTFSADPASPVWPQPVYYSLRTMATVTDGYRPGDIPLQVEDTDAKVETCRLKHEDGSMLLGVWLNQRAVDVCPSQKATVRLTGVKAKFVTGIDPINGVQQKLSFDVKDNHTFIPNVFVTDYPIMFRIR